LNLRDHEGLNLFFDFVMALGSISVPKDEIQGVLQEFDVRNSLSLLAKKQGMAGKTQSLLYKAQIVHGDLNRGNIFLTDGEPRRVIINDFEHAKIGPSVLNWYDFLLRNFVIYGSRYPIGTDTVLQRCHKLPGNKGANPLLNKLTTELLNACQFPLVLHGQLIVLYMSYLCQDPVVSDPEALLRFLKSMDFNLAVVGSW